VGEISGPIVEALPTTKPR